MIATPLKRKYIVDTQLFIQAFRDHAANEALQRFHRAHAPFEYLSVIVAQELRAGIRRPADERLLERHVIGVFARAGRIITPSERAWQLSGNVLASMVRKEGLEVAKLSKAFGNDLLLALSCAETGCVLVTDNRKDFERIRRFTAFDFVTPSGLEP